MGHRGEHQCGGGGGKNLILTPGIYHLDGSIRVNRPATIVLGLGYPTLAAENGATPMVLADVDGIEVGGILFEAGETDPGNLLQVGDRKSSASHASDPDFSVRHLLPERAARSWARRRLINSNNVVGDNFWLWRADHGTGARWNANENRNGLIVNGDDVTLYGLFVEHCQEYQTIWNGNGGLVYFAIEMPTTRQARGWSLAACGSHILKSAKVTSHGNMGPGHLLRVLCRAVIAETAIETPVDGVKMHHMVTLRLNSKRQRDQSCLECSGDVISTRRSRWVVGFRFWILDWGFWIGRRGDHPLFSIRNPQTQFPSELSPAPGLTVCNPCYSSEAQFKASLQEASVRTQWQSRNRHRWIRGWACRMSNLRPPPPAHRNRPRRSGRIRAGMAVAAGTFFRRAIDPPDIAPGHALCLHQQKCRLCGQRGRRADYLDHAHIRSPAIKSCRHRCREKVSVIPGVSSLTRSLPTAILKKPIRNQPSISGLAGNADAPAAWTIPAGGWRKIDLTKAYSNTTWEFDSAGISARCISVVNMPVVKMENVYAVNEQRNIVWPTTGIFKPAGANVRDLQVDTSGLYVTRPTRSFIASTRRRAKSSGSISPRCHW